MQHHTIPYDMSHFPVSPLDIEFLLAGLDGLEEISDSSTDDDLDQLETDEQDHQLTRAEETII